MIRTRRARALGQIPLSVFLVATVPACSWGFNYPGPDGPTYSAPLAGAAPDAVWRQPLNVVSFNLEFGREVDEAIEALQNLDGLAGADLVLMQEMDAEGVARIADALGMAYVYHPATQRGEPRRDFGNAVLSRWPIVESEKLILPHRSLFGRTIRTATRATVQVGRTPVQVYSVHIATPLNQSYRERTDQMKEVLDDARVHPHVIIGGDFNSPSIAEMAGDRGYLWPTEEGPRTVFFGRVDHLMMKGFDPDGTGTVTLPDGISDHRPVWARVRLR